MEIQLDPLTQFSLRVLFFFCVCVFNESSTELYRVLPGFFLSFFFLVEGASLSAAVAFRRR